MSDSDNKDERFDAIADQLDPLVRRLSSDSDNEVLAAVHLLRGRLAASELDIHDFTQRVVQHGFSEAEVQQIHDVAYTKGVADGREQGRRSAVLLDATPTRAFASTDVGVGIGGRTWSELADHFEQHANRLSSWEREFVTSVAEQLRYKGSPSAAQASKLRDILRQRFAGRID